LQFQISLLRLMGQKMLGQGQKMADQKMIGRKIKVQKIVDQRWPGLKATRQTTTDQKAGAKLDPFLQVAELERLQRSTPVGIGVKTRS
jgi:hypothetical protein